MRALPRFKDLRPYQPGKPIEELKRELGLKSVIKLASNENPLGSSPKALAAARASLSQSHRYPEGSAFELRAKIARTWGLKGGHFIFGDGSNEILIFAAQAYCAPGQAIAFSDRSFAVYEIAAHLCGAKIRRVSSPDFSHDLKGLAKAAKGARLVYVCNPNNPTGSFHENREITAFLKKVPRETLVVLDEAYAEFAGVSMAQDNALLKRFPNLLICRTFSKIYGLAGMRVGYGVASEAVIQDLEKCRQPFNLNSVAQKAAAAALDDHGFVRRSLKNNAEGMKRITACFDYHQIWHMPSKANFIFFRQPVDGLYDYLLRKGIILRPMGGPYLRVTLGTRAENGRFIGALEERLR